jgi:hypothetical protein
MISGDVIIEENIAQHIFFIRGEKVMFDFDLAQLYGGPTVMKLSCGKF